MKEEILRDKLQNLSVEQLGWINEYCDNNMSKLKKSVITHSSDMVFQNMNMMSYTMMQ